MAATETQQSKVLKSFVFLIASHRLPDVKM